jgi:hypothetical protein
VSVVDVATHKARPLIRLGGKTTPSAIGCGGQMADEIAAPDFTSEAGVQPAVAYDAIRSLEELAEIKRALASSRGVRPAPVVAYDEVKTLDDARKIKGAIATADFIPGSWRGDLWANIPTALNWANMDPVSPPGAIFFNQRDNGQVWTYTFLSNNLPPDPGSWFASLVASVTDAIAFANQSPLSQPGRIQFNQRDNGQVWIYFYD